MRRVIYGLVKHAYQITQDPEISQRNQVEGRFPKTIRFEFLSIFNEDFVIYYFKGITMIHIVGGLLD